MPLSTAKAPLEQAIKNAFEKSSDVAADGGSAAAVAAELAKLLADAIHDYTTKAQVNVNVSGTAAPLAPTGAAPVTGTGTGTIS